MKGISTSKASTSLMQRASTKQEDLPTLIVLVGPTGVGKTALSIRLAQYFGCSILSADSRQIFREIPIGTAAPSDEERAAVPHYFVGTRSVTEPYSAATFESEVLELLPQVFAESSSFTALLSGGSMMYVDAITKGIDSMPDVPEEVRSAVWERYAAEGLDEILAELRLLDPVYYKAVDPKNYKRVLHSYEVCLATGRPFSSFHTGQQKARPFRIVKVGLTRDREELYERIDKRVELMIEAGMVEEAQRVYPLRSLNALNTVGYKELFSYFDGDIDFAEAVRLIQRNSRYYARKQLSWWRRDPEIRWFHPDAWEEIIAYIHQ